MAEESEEKVKVELELPKSGVSIEPAGNEAEERKARLKKRAQEREKKKEEEKKKEDDSKEVGGYKVSDIAKAPVEPPEPENKKGPNVHQKRVVAFGFAIAIASLVLWPLIGFWYFVAVAIAGAVVVAFGTFFRI